jgi:peptidoglycan/LPS O-acetylase OafA/YrhL
MARSAHIDCLDGLRGFAALWVLFGHASLLTGWRQPLLSWPSLAVDLFMLLSGFLMCFHYVERRDKEPWHALATWGRFWTRRFFRIAPLYYVLLIVAIVLGPTLGDLRDVISAQANGAATEPARYSDTSIVNVLMHVSFLFGFSPSYGYRTALPDWSIGLEMAFYAAFPFLMILVSRIGFVAAAIVTGLACAAASRLFPGFFEAFQEPSFLPMKLPIFFAGILLGGALRASGVQRLAYLAVGALLCVLPIRGVPHLPYQLAVRLACFAVMAVLVDCHRMPTAFGIRTLAQRVAQALGSRLAGFLGDASYCVYLLHLLVMIPVAVLAIRIFPDRALLRFLLTVGIEAPIVLIVSWGLHLWVERPGISWGRRVLARRSANEAAVSPTDRART